MPSFDRPLVIIVGGSPASGKSTIAEFLAEEFHLPLLSRDMFKEALMDTLGSPDPDRSHQLGAAAYAMMAIMQDRLLAAGTGIVLESNFTRGVSEGDLQPVVAKSTAVAIYCTATIEESRRRFAERAASGDRHPGHHDQAPEKLAELERAMISGAYEPLDLDIPHLMVDTTEGYNPDQEAIIRFVREQAGV